MKILKKSIIGCLLLAGMTMSSCDLLTGDEVVTAFEHETFAAFPKGNYTASSPVISYWNTLYQGIRQCLSFEEELNKGGNFSGLEDKDRTDYKAHAMLWTYHPRDHEA